MNSNTHKSFGMPARCVLPFILGIFIAWHYSQILSTNIFIYAICASMLCILIANRHTVVSSFFVYVMTSAIGAFLMSIQIKGMKWDNTNEYAKYEAIITNNPEVHGRTWHLDAVVTKLNGKKLSPFKTKITVLYPTDIFPFTLGDGIECISILKAPQNRRPTKFDYARYLKVQGFKAETFVYSDNIVKKAIKSEDIPLATRIEIKTKKLRAKLISIYSSNNISDDNLAVLSALTLGEKSMLTKEIKNNYSIAGASHILALSGLHLGIIYSLLTLLLWRKNKLWWWKTTVRIILASTIWGYVILVGMPVSAIRSALMLSICLFVEIINRNNNSVNTLLTAAFLLLAFNPLSIFDVGFQMSFIAVLFIILFSTPLYKFAFSKLAEKSYILKTLFKISATSIVAQMGVLPLTMHYFGSIPCYFLLSNFIMIPLATVLLYASIAMLATSAFPFIQTNIATAIDNIVQIMNTSVKAISQIPGANINGITINGIQTICIYIIIFAAILAIKTIVMPHRIQPFNIPYS